MKTEPGFLSAVIVDDEKHCREYLARLLSEHCPDVRLMKACGTFRDAIDTIGSAAPDIVFMDVEMPEGSGFALLEKLSGKKFKVIFTTAHQQYAIQAIRAHAMDYLLKPVLPEELKKAVGRAAEEKDSGVRTDFSGIVFPKISLPTMQGLMFCFPEDIIRCEADGAYTRVHLVSESVLISRNIKVLEELLQRLSFFRVHKSHLINLSHLTGYIRGNGGFAVMSDGSQVEVSKRKREDFLQAIV